MMIGAASIDSVLSLVSLQACQAPSGWCPERDSSLGLPPLSLPRISDSPAGGAASGWPYAAAAAVAALSGQPPPPPAPPAVPKEEGAGGCEDAGPLHAAQLAAFWQDRLQPPPPADGGASAAPAAEAAPDGLATAMRRLEAEATASLGRERAALSVLPGLIAERAALAARNAALVRQLPLPPPSHSFSPQTYIVVVNPPPKDSASPPPPSIARSRHSLRHAVLFCKV